MPNEKAAILQWYQEMGVSDLVSEEAVDKTQQPIQKFKPIAPTSRPQPQSKVVPKNTTTAKPSSMFQDSAPDTPDSTRALAQTAQSLAELRQIMQSFEGCALKKTARNLVFGDGNPKAEVMLIGEAPGADEDQAGLPFVGRSGKLLDKMMATIGLDRTTFYISNIIPWRPPGNRPPTTSETAICLPFIDHHIALVNPKIIVLVGGTAAKSLLGSTDGITNLRGKFAPYHSLSASQDFETFAIYHPAYLLRSPGQKRRAWHDMIVLKHRLQELGLLAG